MNRRTLAYTLGTVALMVFAGFALASFRSELTQYVSFEEARSVFYDDYARQFVDDDHSGHEERFILLGRSNKSRLLIVCHCERQDGDVIRIISARKATAKERKYYEGP